jgi:phosphoribosylaminoimidazole-succinocarboxamide synthase
MAAVVHQSSLHSLPLLSRGKVRDNYAVGNDRLLIVTTDRLSAFDVIMSEPIPDKGRVLNRMALFWFDRLADVVPNHLTGIDPETVVAPDEREQVRDRSMVVKRLKPILVEAVVRGYIIGSGWKDYQATGSVCGIVLPPGLQMADWLPEPIFTPAAKAELGEHDENIGFDDMVARIGGELAERIRAISLELYRRASEYAATRGIIIADTKF